ncbi:MAG: dihydrolipoyl dehydrogenase [Gammaproteobacteria bacterium]|nr:dihydrolipoyl dehydrogenase [Gammaproteobacteria bacterium]MCP4287195.1 dihydrolipoyl dehydrogenase [Gammaproteobacteria bacterium]
MNTHRKCKVLVVGGGPGGYVAAIRAGQLGLDTILVEADRCGGTCLIRGCIPSKALIHAANRFAEISSHAGVGKLGISITSTPQLDFAKIVDWKEGIVNRLSSGVEGLLRSAGVEIIRGWASFVDGKTCEITTEEGGITLQAEHVILATGSVVTELPGIPFSANVISSTEALQLNEVPEHLVVIGAGYIGLELGIAYRKLGAKVTFVESCECILPLYDKELTRPVQQWLKRHDVEVILNASAQSVVEEGTQTLLNYRDSAGENHQLAGDKVLVTVGRKPNTEGWGLENILLEREGTFIKVDNQCCTATKNVWAIGDLVGEPMLAHKASAQGEMVAEIISGRRRSFEPVAIPAVCFTEPEVVSVGLMPDAAKAQGMNITVGKFPFAAIGKALTMEAGEDGGFVRIVARSDDRVIVGIQAVGAQVAELSGEFALALEMGALADDVAATIHAHPSLGEATMEASLATFGKAIHVP